MPLLRILARLLRLLPARAHLVRDHPEPRGPAPVSGVRRKGRAVTWNDADLASLRAKVFDRKHTETAIAADVRWLRQQGCPWSLIAEELGVSRQSAWEKYGKTPPPSPDDEQDEPLPL